MPKDNRSRSWCYTLNNYTAEEESKLQALDARYHLYGREVGEAGTPHLQGYLYFQAKKSLRQVKAMVGDRAHLEIARGSPEQNEEYCSKQGDVFRRGNPPKGMGKTLDRAGKNRLLREKSLESLVEDGDISILTVPVLQKARRILSLAATPLQRMSTCGLWIYGPPGTGKTHYARTVWDDVFMKAQNKWFDGYAGESTILLDDLDTGILGHYLKRWLDKWPCYGEVKGGTVALQHTRFIITSNYKPEQLWPDDYAMCQAIERRCTFMYLSKRRDM